MDNADLYRTLYTIRRFEETVLENFPKGVFHGTTHTYLGQEANAAGILTHLQPEDIVFSNHRCHGHFLAYGGDPRALFAEMMGKPTGVCAGRGGSQHLQWRNFYSNGIQGGIVPVATGMALAEKRKGSRALAVCFLGDGTLGQGVIYESFNLAALWGAPVLYVVEDNRIAQTTPTDLALAGEIAARFRAFGIPVHEADTSDVLEVHALAGALLEEIRTLGAPRALILHTARFGPHSKGDDTRDPAVVSRLRERRDPLKIHRARLTPAESAAIEAEISARVGTAFQTALEDGRWTADDASYSVPHTSYLVPHTPNPQPPNSHPPNPQPLLASLNAGLQRAFQADERVLILGEDLLDPYGGAFKVTRGLSTAFPERVLPTPISEAAITGLAAGMALRGLRPVVEIMFGDFVTLIADQVVNHIAKFRWMYNDQVRVPLVIRTPMGGRRGYGPTHSQSIEKLYLGVPGLRILAPAALGDPGALLAESILYTEDPVLFIENKLLYLERIFNGDGEWIVDERRWTVDGGQQTTLRTTYHVPPTYRLTLRGAPPPDLTIAAYGYMAGLARQAATRLAYEHEIFAEIIVPTQLTPVDDAAILDSVRRTGRLLTVEEGTLTLGWGAEIAARAAEALGPSLRAVQRVAARDLPIPASLPLEERVLPQVEDIIAAGRRLVG
ncbi:MAG: alpha-ketoacid dehydrogenase subunit alpha/beta [Anaerolineales bacterium]